jgi:hypothetical protein
VKRRSAPLPSTTCPACNRFIGFFLECPYCGIESPALPLQRTLRLMAITLGIGGITALLLIAHYIPAPAMPVAQLRPVMNYGYVTLTGTVVAEPRIIGNPASPQSISFELADAGGQLMVTAARAVASELLVHDNLPSATQPVQATGHLYLVAGRSPRMYLDSIQSKPQNGSHEVRPP